MRGGGKGRRKAGGGVDAELLAEHSGITPREREKSREARAFALGSLANTIALYAGTLTAQEVARKIGVDPSRVHHRIRDESLYGGKIGTRVRLPLWQFDQDGRLPSLAKGVRKTLDGCFRARLADPDLQRRLTELIDTEREVFDRLAHGDLTGRPRPRAALRPVGDGLGAGRCRHPGGAHQATTLPTQAGAAQ